MTPAISIIAITIPSPNGIKNSKSTSSSSCFLNVLMSPFSNGFRNNSFMLLMEFISLSYIPVMSAIVPPDIPGMISDVPISSPLRNIFIISI